jgi:hypothetical protein
LCAARGEGLGALPAHPSFAREAGSQTSSCGAED